MNSLSDTDTGTIVYREESILLERKKLSDLRRIYLHLIMMLAVNIASCDLWCQNWSFGFYAAGAVTCSPFSVDIALERTSPRYPNLSDSPLAVKNIKI